MCFESWKKHHFQLKETIHSKFQSALNFVNASNFVYHAGIPFQKLMINTQLVEAGPTVNLKKDHMKDFLIKKKKKHNKETILRHLSQEIHWGFSAWRTWTDSTIFTSYIYFLSLQSTVILTKSCLKLWERNYWPIETHSSVSTNSCTLYVLPASSSYFRKCSSLLQWIDVLPCVCMHNMQH